MSTTLPQERKNGNDWLGETGENATEDILVWTSREETCELVLRVFWGRDKGCDGR